MVVYRELSSLTNDLGFSRRTLYGVSNQITKHYHTTVIPKADGGTRTLHIPDKQLKAIQRQINEIILAPTPISPFATAYRPGCSTKINALLHVGKPVLLKLDILHFFDSIIYPLVKETAFPADRFSESNRILLTILCTYHDSIPQGAPTSPAISNIVMRGFDNMIGKWCESQKIGYTRYCDDMTFSGNFDPAQVIDLVRGELRGMGFFINGKKTALIRDGRQKIVTGLVVNSKESVPAAYRHKIRQEMHYCMRYGIASHLDRAQIPCSTELYVLKLLGRVNYVLSVSPEDPDFREYKTWLLGQKQFSYRDSSGAEEKCPLVLKKRMRKIDESKKTGQQLDGVP